MQSTPCCRTSWSGPKAKRAVSSGDRIDVAIVARGLARSRVRAAELIRSGLVRVDGRPVRKPGQIVSPNSQIEIASGGAEAEYVSRAAVKLAGALDAFDSAYRAGAGDRPRVDAASCVDVGASTGGFTDVLLRRGAREVLAIDVGHDQFDVALRSDPRVCVREGFNVRDMSAQDVPRDVSLVVGDLSFISLRLVLPALVRSTPQAHMLLMVKPQFEVGRQRLGRGGVVRQPELHIDSVRQVCACARDLGLETRAIVASSLPGPSGNREFFCWFVPQESDQDQGAVSSAITGAVTDTTEGRHVFYVKHEPAAQNGRDTGSSDPQGGTG